jgi:MinD-like ATPase involved in chromosome partitioning or flagellar assembly
LLHGETVTTSGRYVSLADGVIISSGPSPDEIRATAAHFRASRRQGAAAGEIVVFTRAAADSPARDIAAKVSEFAAAGATHVAVNADEDDADLERFVALLAREVSPLVRAS